MNNYVSKPIEVQAIQFTGDNWEEIEKLSMGTIIDNDETQTHMFKVRDGQGMLSFFRKGDYFLRNPVNYWISSIWRMLKH